MTGVFPDLADQRALVEDFMRPAAALLPVARLHYGDDDALWREMAELGWLGISLSEDDGGIGLGAVEEVLAAATLGRQLVSPGFVATIVAAHALARAGRRDAVGELLIGTARAGFVIAGGGVVAARGARWLVVLGDDAVSLHDAGATTLLDEAHWGRPLDRVALTAPILTDGDARLLARARMLLAASLAGIAGATAEHGVDYAKMREQFGQPIGAFQSIKHQCADMAIAAHAARELATYAAVAFDEHRADAGRLADAALSFAARAALGNAGTNIQVHGGMGFSAECDAHLYLKAARVLEAAGGGVTRARGRLLRREGTGENGSV